MIDSPILAARTCIMAARSAVMSELAGEAIILDPNSGTYYGLTNDVGVRVWQLIQQETTFGDICQTILAEYDVDAAQCEHDVAVLLRKLTNNDLVCISDAIAP